MYVLRSVVLNFYLSFLSPPIFPSLPPFPVPSPSHSSLSTFSFPSLPHHHSLPPLPTPPSSFNPILCDKLTLSSNDLSYY